MTKQQLIDAVVAHLAENNEGKASVTKKQAGEIVDAAFAKIAESIVADGKFQMPGFGTFQVKERGERKGRNPQTQEEITIAASKNVAFKAATVLKNLLNPETKAEEKAVEVKVEEKKEAAPAAKKAATKAPAAKKTTKKA